MDAGRRKFLIVAGGVVLVLLAVMLVFAHARRQPQIVRELTVGNESFQIGLPESGVIQYPQIQTMSSQVSANVAQIFVKAGDRVSAGRLLATLESPQVLSNAQSSGAAYRAAAASARSAQATGRSNVVQAEANLEAARARFAQARQDLANGLQSGLGYGESTAADQRAQADAALATAATALREARRVYVAYQNLYGQKAVSRDQLDRSAAQYEQAQVAYSQARLTRASLGTQLVRSRTVLQDNFRSAQEGVAQAEAALETARVESGGGDVAAAAAQAARAGSEYALAQEQADAMEVRAPYDAIVLSVATEKNDPLRPLQPGDAVAVGQPLLTLAARRAFVVRTRVDEQDVINVHLGERVQITGEDFPGRVLGGHVVEISPIAQDSGDASSATRTVATTILIDQPPAYLRDGMSAQVNILTTDIAHAIVVPNEAIVRAPGLTYVYVVRHGSAYRQPVRVGLSNETSSLIASGLHSGDVVVAQSTVGLTDGADVAMPALSTPSHS
jgi:RND family efflux transporter MFP subunit